MNPLLIVAIFSFGMAATAGFTGSLLIFMMIGEVNRKKDDENQIPYFSWHPGKRSAIFSEYRRLYPEGRLFIYLVVAGAVMFMGLGGAFLCLCLMGFVFPPQPSRP